MSSTFQLHYGNKRYFRNKTKKQEKKRIKIMVDLTTIDHTAQPELEKGEEATVRQYSYKERTLGRREQTG